MRWKGYISQFFNLVHIVINYTKGKQSLQVQSCTPTLFIVKDTRSIKARYCIIATSNRSHWKLIGSIKTRAIHSIIIRTCFNYRSMSVSIQTTKTSCFLPDLLLLDRCDDLPFLSLFFDLLLLLESEFDSLIGDMLRFFVMSQSGTLAWYLGPILLFALGYILSSISMQCISKGTEKKGRIKGRCNCYLGCLPCLCLHQNI